MAKILIEASPGDQRIAEVAQGERFICAQTILWDERVDGALVVESDKVGAYSRNRNALEVDSVKLSQLQSRRSQEAQKEQDETDRTGRFKSLSKSSTVEDFQQAVIDLVKHLNLG